MSEPGLISKPTIQRIVIDYLKAAQCIRDGFNALVAARATLGGACGVDDFDALRLRDARNCYLNIDDPEATIAKLEREVWGVLVEQLEIKRMMSISAAAKLDEQLEKGVLPRLSTHAVMTMFQGFADQLPQMLTEAVTEVYDWLRPHEGYAAATYKTNQKNAKFELGERIVITWIIDRQLFSWNSAHPFKLNYGCQQKFVALENVFSALDGRGQINKGHISAVEAAVRVAGHDGKWETEYFSGRACKNGNLHLRFLRADLLAKFNAVAGGKRLKGAA